MSKKAKTTLKVTSLIVVILLALMHINIVSIPAIAAYKFWIMVGAFPLLLIASR